MPAEHRHPTRGVLEVLRHLSALGLVTPHRTPTHTIYRLAERHPMRGVLRRLFESEEGGPAVDGPRIGAG